MTDLPVSPRRECVEQVLMVSTESDDTLSTFARVCALARIELDVLRFRLASIFNVVVFFVAAVSLFPMGVTRDPTLLAQIGPGVIWVCALLAVQLAMLRFFSDDQRSGQIEQLLLSYLPLPVILLVRALAVWVSIALPIMCLAPLLSVGFSLPLTLWPAWVVSLGVGIFPMVMVGMISASLTLGVKQGGVLAVVIGLPLLVPVLLLGSSLIYEAAAGRSWLAPTYLLIGIAVLASVLGSIATAAALRLMLD